MSGFFRSQRAESLRLSSRCSYADFDKRLTSSLLSETLVGVKNQNIPWSARWPAIVFARGVSRGMGMGRERESNPQATAPAEFYDVASYVYGSEIYILSQEFTRQPQYKLGPTK